MIKLLGVATETGLPVFFQTFVEIKDVNTYISGLLSAVSALSELLGGGEVRQIAFEKDKLFVSATKKGYLVVALASAAEEYIEALIRLIAEDIDRDPNILENADFVDSDLESAVKNILSKYVARDISVKYSDIVSNIWEPIQDEIEKREDLKRMLEERFNKLEEITVDQAQKWSQIVSKAKGNIEDALKHAFQGDFHMACAIAMNCCKDDKLGRLFAIKMGILSLEQCGVPSPTISQLLTIISLSPERDPFLKLLEGRLKLMKNIIGLPEYLELMRNAISNIDLSVNSRETLIKAICLVDPTLRFFSDFAVKLEQFLRKYSDILADLVSVTLKRDEMLRKAYTFTDINEVLEYLDTYESKLEESTRELNKILRGGLIRRIFGISPRGAKVNQIVLNYSFYLELYMMTVALIVQSPAVGLKEKKEFIERILSIYEKYFKRLILEGYPIMVTSAISAFQSIWIALGEYLVLIEEQRKDEFLTKAQAFLDELVKFVMRDSSRLSMGLQVLTTAVSSIGQIFSKTNTLNIDELFLVSVILRNTDEKVVEGWKRILPYNFAAFTVNLSVSLGYLAARLLEGERRLAPIKFSLDTSIELIKWLLSQGKIGRIAITILSTLLNPILSFLNTQELDRYVDVIVRFLRISIPSFEKYDYEIAMLSDYILPILDYAVSKGLTHYESLLKSLVSIAVKAWEKHGFSGKAKRLKEAFSKYKIS